MQSFNKFFAAACILLMASCGQQERISQKKDYEKFLDPAVFRQQLEQNRKEIRFWSNRLKMDPESYINMLETGRYLLKEFSLTGEAVLLHTGDSLLHAASARLNHTDPEILYALSQNSITRHRFARAGHFVSGAEKAGGDAYTLCLLRFDVSMELGQYAAAEACLRRLQDKSGFDYLIRQAKWEDHGGDLDKAIVLMETALEKVKGRPALSSWALSNLADMYGHAGRIREAYKAYLEVLHMDPGNLHCLEGIAWIAWSNDSEAAAAKKIYEFILSVKKQPEIRLVLADLAVAEGNFEKQRSELSAFMRETADTAHRVMYNKYRIAVLADELQEPAKAVALAKEEVLNRFTPETCDWLAWSLYKQGLTDSAFRYAHDYVYKRSYEPDIMYHTAVIFLSAGRLKEARALLEECRKSHFEMGPLQTKKVEALLKQTD